MLKISKDHVMLATVFIMSFMATFAGAQQIQWLQYHTAREARSIVGDYALVTLELGQDKPPGIPLPEFTNEQPLFTRWASPLAQNGHLWLALDRSHLNGPYDRLFIDSNGDSSLKDEEAITAYRTDAYYANFGPVQVVFQGEDGPITYHLNFECYNTSDRRDLRVYAGCWYEGEVQTGAKKVKCTLIDHNANGTFNDISLDPGQSDRIRIGNDTRFVGRYLDIDGNMFEPEIAQDGAFIKVKPAENVVHGTIQLPEKIAEFDASGENGLFTLKLKDGKARLPVGKYHIERWTVERTDEQDIPWKLAGTNTGKASNFEVNQSDEISIKVGEPIISELTVTQPNNTTYSFNQNLKGQMGELISLTRNGVRPRPPKIHIINADGSYDRTYSLEYG